MSDTPRSPFEIVPRTWLGRVLACLAALAVIVVGFFFLAIALAVGGVILFIVFVRVLWLMHRLRREREKSAPRIIEGEYSVTEETPRRYVRKDRDET